MSDTAVALVHHEDGSYDRLFDEAEVLGAERLYGTCAVERIVRFVSPEHDDS